MLLHKKPSHQDEPFQSKLYLIHNYSMCSTLSIAHLAIVLNGMIKSNYEGY